MNDNQLYRCNWEVKQFLDNSTSNYLKNLAKNARLKWINSNFTDFIPAYTLNASTFPSSSSSISSLLPNSAWPPFSHTNTDCKLSADDYKVLSNIVVNKNYSHSVIQSRSRLLCMSFTISNRHGIIKDGIIETWGKRCDGTVRNQ
jgi:hypothetical protein